MLGSKVAAAVVVVEGCLIVVVVVEYSLNVVGRKSVEHSSLETKMPMLTQR